MQYFKILIGWDLIAIKAHNNYKVLWNRAVRDFTDYYVYHIYIFLIK